jgi:hypothetical protein
VSLTSVNPTSTIYAETDRDRRSMRFLRIAEKGARHSFRKITLDMTCASARAETVQRAPVMRRLQRSDFAVPSEDCIRAAASVARRIAARHARCLLISSSKPRQSGSNAPVRKCLDGASSEHQGRARTWHDRLRVVQLNRARSA